MLTMLAHGLPMLLVPQGADQFDNAAACVATGVASRLFTHQLAPQGVGAAVESLLADGAGRERAREVEVEIAAMRTPAELVPVLLHETG